MTVGDTAQICLDEPGVFVGDTAQLIRSARADGEGTQVDPAGSVEADPAVNEETGRALAVAGSVATIPVAFPDVR